jgi:glycosyltransferase involved in cell wall biosynthesis
VNARGVLHILPIDLARGAQTYARELRGALDTPAVPHRTLTLFAGPPAALQADVSLGVRPGVLRRLVDPRGVARLRRHVRREDPAVVVAHGGEPLEYAVLAGVPVDRLVYYKIGIGGARLTPARRALHRWLLGRTRVVAAVSHDSAAELATLGVPDERVRVVPNGRDPDRFPEWRGHDGTAVRLAFVGHMTSSKRPERFVAVVRALRDRGLDVEGRIAGDGPALAGLEPAAADAGVHLLGRVDDVATLLATSDAFVFTSVAEGEGMPGVLIEGGLAGLPVVTTAVPGAAEVVDDGVTGTVVAVDDFDALVAATETLVVDPARRRALGAAARRRCEERFSLAASIAGWRDLLAEIAADECTSST